MSFAYDEKNLHVIGGDLEKRCRNAKPSDVVLPFVYCQVCESLGLEHPSLLGPFVDEQLRERIEKRQQMEKDWIELRARIDEIHNAYYDDGDELIIEMCYPLFETFFEKYRDHELFEQYSRLRDAKLTHATFEEAAADPDFVHLFWEFFVKITP